MLVTGVGGFVGRFAAARLAERHRVVGLYRRSFPDGLAATPSIDLIQGDLREVATLPKQIDWLLHCAAEVPATCSSPEELYRTNVEGCRNVFGHAVEAGARGIIYLSSMAAFGAISGTVVSERTPCREPTVYGRSKADGEVILRELAADHGLRTASIRLPGIVGAGSRNNFLSDVGRKIMHGETVRAANPSALFNNIVHVRALCEFFETLLDTLPPGHVVLTLGATEPLAIRDVLGRLFRQCDRPERLEFAPQETSSFIIEFETARALGYRPQTVQASLDAFAADLVAGAGAA